MALGGAQGFSPALLEHLKRENGKDPLSYAATDEFRALLQPARCSSSQRQYRKLSSGQGKLKVLIRVVNEAGQKAEATVDLYSSRSRRLEGA
ncbi:MAG: hypothetical protein U0931_16595 [Vulcanimicrobiota bacterium]